jgi:L-malate glycosyltransferase
MTSRPVRVAFFDARSHSFYGAQISMRTIVTNVDRACIQPVVITTADDALASGFREAGVDVQVLPLGARANVFGGEALRGSLISKLRRGVDVLSFMVRLRTWLREEHVDVLYANDLRSLLLGGLPARILGLKVLWYVREDRRLGVFQHVGVRLAHRIVTIADGVRRAFTPRELARHEDRFVTLMTGFDVGRYAHDKDARKAIRRSLSIPAEARVIGLVGSLTARKGHDLLVAAAKRIVAEHPATHFLFVGSSPKGQPAFADGIRADISAAGLDSRIHWLGYTDNVAGAYSAMDLLVLPSRSEGLPRTVIEALAAGLRVVASDAGGTGEILTQPDLGEVLAANEAECIAEAVIRALAKPATAEDAQLRHDYVRDRFSVDAFVRGFAEIVERLACGHRA